MSVAETFGIRRWLLAGFALGLVGCTETGPATAPPPDQLPAVGGTSPGGAPAMSPSGGANAAGASGASGVGGSSGGAPSIGGVRGAVGVGGASSDEPGPIRSPRVWGGANAWFLHMERSADRLATLDAAQAAGLTVLRIFIREIKQQGFVDYVSGVDNDTVPDVENEQGFNDAVLARVDQLMLEAKERGIKLIISLHDRWYLGDWEGDDVYTRLYGVKNGSQALHDFYDPVAGAEMMRRFDARLAHVLTHVNPLLGGRAWGELDDVVFSFEAQNEAMGHFPALSSEFAGDWQCRRAKAMRPYVKGRVLISTGGVTNAYDSALPSFFDCPEIDVIGIHNYDKGSGVPEQLAMVTDLARAKNKRVIIEEFSCDPRFDDPIYQAMSDADYAAVPEGEKLASRASCNQLELARYESAGLPWMLWALVKPGDVKREVWLDDPFWPTLVSHAMNPPATGFSWPELP